MSTDPTRTIAPVETTVNPDSSGAPIPIRRLMPRTHRVDLSALRLEWPRTDFEPPPPPPATRAGCANVPRPCPHILCRHHLLLEARPGHELKALEDGVDTCALDVAERGPAMRATPGPDGPATLAEVGAILGTSRERVRQVEAVALGKLMRHANHGIVLQLAEYLEMTAEAAAEVAERAREERNMAAKKARKWDSLPRKRGRPPIIRESWCSLTERCDVVSSSRPPART